MKKTNCTQRQVFSTVSQVFEPLRFMASFVIRGRMLIKRIWQTQGQRGDSPIAEDINTEFSKWLQEWNPPDVKATFLQRNTTTLELSFINPNTGWDFFSVDVAPVIPQAIVNKTISSLPLEIAGLESGAQYNFKVSVAITKFCDYGINHPSSFFVTTCTIPTIPTIKEDDQTSVAIVNQTSITLIGKLINFSDAYSVIGLLENGKRVSNFTRVQSTTAENNLTLPNLTAGSTYTVELVSVIGTTTDCGGNTIDSSLKLLAICTDPPNFDAAFVQRNTSTIELTSITPSSGWDFFSVETNPPTLQTIFNESFFNLPLPIKELVPGTQYNLSVSVVVTIHCEYGTNHPSSFFVTTCT
ncbi:uncharacterized protein LOC142356060, partial [Convolutriloba macropyga]|uniref:uncharacterized protein LOC142356060 n=1 Tax=Convolutriloba macropyga TaxID=536237 RepID=UPI003F51CC1B